MLIVGLGNPGRKYEGTRHNVGFRVVDALRERWALPEYAKSFESEFTRGLHAGRPVMLLKPQTYMNLSGSAVLAATTFYKVSPATGLWIVHDDLDLPLGKLRIRQEGSSGGHNGVADIMTRLDTDRFTRFRLGIGRPEDRMPIEDHVLRPFAKGEEEAVEEMVKKCVLAVESAWDGGLERAMTMYNA